MKKGNFVLLLFFVFWATSCEITQLNQPDDEEEIDVVEGPTVAPTSTAEFENLFHGGSQRSWKTISFTFMGVGGIQDCRLDDSMTINADGTYEYDGGANLCGAEDSERVRTGTWEVTNDGRNIVFDSGTVNEYTADVTGAEDDQIALSGQYIGLNVSGVYQIN
ncbi:MAG: hypothetical protein AAGA64_09945 [Bacteroidota bacterium]